MTDKEFREYLINDKITEDFLPNGRVIKSTVRPRLTRKLVKAKKAIFRKKIDIYRKFIKKTE